MAALLKVAPFVVAPFVVAPFVVAPFVIAPFEAVLIVVASFMAVLIMVVPHGDAGIPRHIVRGYRRICDFQKRDGKSDPLFQQ